MKIVIPMAGMGKRMRPHTLTTPKPLIPIAGKTIVERLIEELVKSVDEPIEEIAYIIGDFGDEVEKSLLRIATDLGVKGSLYYQKEALGTAHAIYCAKESLGGNVIVAFADTLFKTDFKIQQGTEGVIWVKRVEDPSAFGVVTLNGGGVIDAFVEKPKEPVSDLAIIGIYYFKDGDMLRNEIAHIIDNNLMDGGEYQLTRVLENMKQKGISFLPGEVDQWMDCGNKMATLDTNTQILKTLEQKELRGLNTTIEQSLIIEPCFIGDGTVIKNSVVGPYVSIEAGGKIENAVISKSIVQTNAQIRETVFTDSMIGKEAEIHSKQTSLNIGDYSKIE